MLPLRCRQHNQLPTVSVLPISDIDSAIGKVERRGNMAHEGAEVRGAIVPIIIQLATRRRKRKI
jgi:hypothetical protein